MVRSAITATVHYGLCLLSRWAHYKEFDHVSQESYPKHVTPTWTDTNIACHTCATRVCDGGGGQHAKVSC